MQWYKTESILSLLILFFNFLEIDECQRLLDNCQQKCINTEGSFNCSCNDGFILQDDKRTCKGKFSKLMHVLILVLFI